MRSFRLGNFNKFCPIRWQTNITAPCFLLFEPVIEPTLPFTRMRKVFYFHLLKLACAKDKIARCDFIAESVPHLRDAERNAYTHTLRNKFKINKLSLSRLGSQIHKILIILNG